MTGTDPLTRLATVDPGTRPHDLAAVGARARALRRGRTTGRAGAVLGLAGLLAVGGAVLPGAGDDEGGPVSAVAVLGITSAGAVEPSCEGGTGRYVEPGAWDEPVVTALASEVTGSALPLTAVAVHEVTTPCPATVPTAVLYAVGDAPRGIALYAGASIGFASDADLREARVQGSPARWATSGGLTAVDWTAPDGTAWAATADGMDADRALRVLDALHVSGSELLDDDAPDGLLLAGPAGAPGPRTDTWWIEYGTAVPEEPASGTASPAPRTLPATPGYVRLHVTAAVTPWQADLARTSGAEVVSVDGVPGVVLRDDGGHLVLRWSAGGLAYELLADGGTAQDLVALAAGVAPADPVALAGTPAAAATPTGL